MTSRSTPPGWIAPFVIGSALVSALGCSTSRTAAPAAGAAGKSPGSGGSQSVYDAGSVPKLPYVFVVAMENHDAQSIYGNSSDAPYLNDTLAPIAAIADDFTDELPLSIPSEPHYVWMEAGTNAFADHTFTDDSVPSASNSTAETAHLVTQIAAAGGGLDWRSYQEGLDATTGACPVAGSGYYQPKHDPFVFFQDVSGNPPSETNATCAAHHAPLSALATDLAANKVVAYSFVTPDQCHDMHGQSGCPDSNTIRAGDQWLAQNLPPLIAFVGAHGGVVLVTWDEGSGTNKMPFYAVGPNVRKHSTSHGALSHSSLLKSLDEMLGLTVLKRVASANDFADLFTPPASP